MSKIIQVETKNANYPIHIKNGLRFSWARIIKSYLRGHKVVVITDENVAPLYGAFLINQLEELGIDASIYLIAPGETSKSLLNYESISTKLIEANITRSDLIVALGGGVVGDLTGFVAATLLRGIDFIQIPTSLLAQIDSSVGGKVAVNLPIGKNLLGSFYHPKAVLIDPEVLKTLDKRVLADGMGEVIKYACIKDKEFFSLLSNSNLDLISDIFEDIIARCCQIKADIVKRDEKESSERMLLNFGHTLGHVIESYYGYSKYTHGEAVGLGMLMIIELGESLGLTQKRSYDRVKKLMTRYNLPTDYPKMDKEKMLKIIAHDKKSLGKTINTIYIDKIGSSFIKPTELNVLLKIV